MKRRSRAGPERAKSRRRKTKTQKRRGLRTPSAAGHKTQSDVAQLTREREESLGREKATAQVLHIISSSPGKLEPVFQAVMENAVRLCEAKFGILYLHEEERLRIVASYNVPPALAEARKRAPFLPPPTGHIAEAIRTKQAVQVADLVATRAYAERSAPTIVAVELGGVRTAIAVPMFTDNELIGIIIIYRQEVRPFTDKQIELVKNFAAQAVIAIENARLLNELRQRTDDLTESLEQQTATSEVLQVISSSPGQLEPVFNAMLANAMRICGAKFGVMHSFADGAFRALSWLGISAEFSRFLREPRIWGHETGLGRVAITKRAVHIYDARSDPAYIEGDPGRLSAVNLGGARSFVIVPMLKEGDLVGAFSIFRQEVKPFTDKQIELVQSFAAQAVIAIENTRLLNELRESLQQQTATAEVLKVISSSPGELEPVFQAMLENATRICEAKFGTLFRFDGEAFRAAAVLHHSPRAQAEVRRRVLVVRDLHPDVPIARMTRSKDIIQVADMRQAQCYALWPTPVLA
jgi:GAF domain-containing protein